MDLYWIGSFALRAGQTACKDCSIGKYASSGIAKGQSTDVSEITLDVVQGCCAMQIACALYQASHFGNVMADLYRVRQGKVLRNRAGDE